GGNAATRLDAYVSKNGIYTAGVMPDVEDLFQRQARETDPKKREALLHQIQGVLHERVTHVPIYELAFIWGVGPRVEEPGINLIRSFAYSGPLEDVRVKRQCPPRSRQREREPDRLAAGGAPRDGLGELHVAHAVVERGSRHPFLAANRVDELLLHAPAAAALGGDGDL